MLARSSKLLRYHLGLMLLEHERPRCLVDQEHSVVSSVQIMIERPMPGAAALGHVIVGFSSFRSVGAEQIVKGEPAWSVLREQVRAGQFAK